MMVNCHHCGKTVKRPTCHVKRVKHVYCSKACHDIAQSSRVQKDCLICGDSFEVRPCEASKFATCTKPDCRRANKTGEKNPKWRGGITAGSRKATLSTKEYREWRKAVFQRDDYTCQHCGKRGGALEADHIKPWAYFPDLRYEQSNGRTLCVPCHRKTFKLLEQHRQVAAGQMQISDEVTQLWAG